MISNIVILGKPYAIEYKKVMDDAGLLWTNEQRIFINASYGEDQQRETLLHEVIHAVSNELLLNLDEKTVARLAVGIYSAGYRIPLLKEKK